MIGGWSHNLCPLPWGVARDHVAYVCLAEVLLTSLTQAVGSTASTCLPCPTCAQTINPVRPHLETEPRGWGFVNSLTNLSMIVMRVGRGGACGDAGKGSIKHGEVKQVGNFKTKRELGKSVWHYVALIWWKLLACVLCLSCKSALVTIVSRREQIAGHVSGEGPVGDSARS